jgi:hypothetical protein
LMHLYHVGYVDDLVSYIVTRSTNKSN